MYAEIVVRNSLHDSRRRVAPLSDGDLVRDGDDVTRPGSPQVDSVLEHLGMVGLRYR